VKPKPFRLIVFVLLAALALPWAGCVYLRLLQLKNQLAEANKNFKMDVTDGVRIACLHPILYGDDVRWLGIEPESVSGDPEQERWKVRWVKEPPPEAHETTVYNVELAATFAQSRLSEIYIPERYFAFFPKELFVNLLRSTGAAKIDRISRQADVNAAADPEKPSIPLPRITAIEGMLGLPTERKESDAEVTCRYRYNAMTTGEKVKPIEVSFIFDRETGELRKLIGKLPKGVISYDLTAAKAAKPPKPVKKDAASRASGK
jgi:hypothetical protein